MPTDCCVRWRMESSTNNYHKRNQLLSYRGAKCLFHWTIVCKQVCRRCKWSEKAGLQVSWKGGSWSSCWSCRSCHHFRWWAIARFKFWRRKSVDSEKSLADCNFKRVKEPARHATNLNRPTHEFNNTYNETSAGSFSRPILVEKTSQPC